MLRKVERKRRMTCNKVNGVNDRDSGYNIRRSETGWELIVLKKIYLLGC